MISKIDSSTRTLVLGRLGTYPIHGRPLSSYREEYDIPVSTQTFARAMAVRIKTVSEVQPLSELRNGPLIPSDSDIGETGFSFRFALMYRHVIHDLHLDRCCRMPMFYVLCKSLATGPITRQRVLHILHPLYQQIS